MPTLAPIAVIDWEMGTDGDPFGDLAVLLSCWAEPGDPECMRYAERQVPTLALGFWRRCDIIDS